MKRVCAVRILTLAKAVTVAAGLGLIIVEAIKASEKECF